MERGHEPKLDVCQDFRNVDPMKATDGIGLNQLEEDDHDHAGIASTGVSEVRQEC